MINDKAFNLYLIIENEDEILKNPKQCSHFSASSSKKPILKKKHFCHCEIVNLLLSEPSVLVVQKPEVLFYVSLYFNDLNCCCLKFKLNKIPLTRSPDCKSQCHHFQVLQTIENKLKRCKNSMTSIWPLNELLFFLSIQSYEYHFSIQGI